jgi:hypothetical protein
MVEFAGTVHSIVIVSTVWLRSARVVLGVSVSIVLLAHLCLSVLTLVRSQSKMVTPIVKRDKVKKRTKTFLRHNVRRIILAAHSALADTDRSFPALSCSCVCVCVSVCRGIAVCALSEAADHQMAQAPRY